MDIENLTPLVSLVLVVTVVVMVITYVWVSLALAAIFRKLGAEGWKAWVPVYNQIVYFILGKQNPLWLIAFLIPVGNIVGLVFQIRATHQINRRFSKGAGFTVFALLLYPIWASILGFGRAVAIDPDAAPVYEPITKVPYGAPPIAQPPKQAAATSTPGVPISAAPGFAPPPPPPPPAAPPVTSAPVTAFAPGMPTGAPALISSAPGFPPPPAAAPAAAPMVQPYGQVPRQGNPWAPPGTPVAAAPAAPAAPPVAAPYVPPAPVTPPAPAPVSYAAPVQAPAPPASLEPELELDDDEDGRTMLVGRAQHDDDEGGEHTVIVGRRAKPWFLTTDDGQSVRLTQPVALLGRNPTKDRAYPDAQLVPLNDTAKTVSKTHARIELNNGAWQIVDLDSTNGVVLFVRAEETELQAGVPAVLTERFLLGELPVRIHLEA